MFSYLMEATASDSVGEDYLVNSEFTVVGPIESDNAATVAGNVAKEYDVVVTVYAGSDGKMLAKYQPNGDVVYVS